MLTPSTEQRARAAIEATVPHASIDAMRLVGVGRGIFAEIVHVSFVGDEPSVVVKLASDGPNGDAARRSGAYEREAMAYRTLLDLIDVRRPRCLGVIDDPLGPTLVLEDLTPFRFADQLDGLELDDALEVAATLGRMHLTSPSPLPGDVRTNAVAGFGRQQLAAGLRAVREQWSHVVSAEQQRAFAALVDDRDGSAQRFAESGPPVLCHGDPRADNLAFDAGRPILFDWQQIAVQPGVGDLAWLVATSVEPAIRRTADHQLIETYRRWAGHDVDFDAYRAGFILPGLAVLFLAQRDLDTPRTAAFVEASLRRIGDALIDLDVAGR